MTQTPDKNALSIAVRHRRHVELSPGVGKEVQDYALAVCDDIINDLSALSHVAPCTHSPNDCVDKMCDYYGKCQRADKAAAPSSTRRIPERLTRCTYAKESGEWIVRDGESMMLCIVSGPMDEREANAKAIVESLSVAVSATAAPLDQVRDIRKQAFLDAAALVDARAGSGGYAESMGAHRILTSAADALRAMAATDGGANPK